MQKKEPYRTWKVSVRLFLKAGMFFAVVWKVAQLCILSAPPPGGAAGKYQPV